MDRTVLISSVPSALPITFEVKFLYYWIGLRVSVAWA